MAPSKTRALSLSEAADSFTLYLRAKNLADKTVTSYLESVRSFAEWLDANGVADDVMAVTRTHVRGFLLSLRERGLKASTERVRYASLRQFFKFLLNDEEIDSSTRCSASRRRQCPRSRWRCSPTTSSRG